MKNRSNRYRMIRRFCECGNIAVIVRNGCRICLRYKEAEANRDKIDRRTERAGFCAGTVEAYRVVMWN